MLGEPAPREGQPDPTWPSGTRRRTPASRSNTAKCLDTAEVPCPLTSETAVIVPSRRSSTSSLSRVRSILQP